MYSSFVEVYLDKSTGRLELGMPYTGLENKPKKLEISGEPLGTAIINFHMPFKIQPKFKKGDKVKIFGFIPAVVVNVDPENELYTFDIPKEAENLEGNYIGTGLYNMEFAWNGRIVLDKNEES